MSAEETPARVASSAGAKETNLSSEPSTFSKERPECGALAAYRYEQAGVRIVPVQRGGKSPRVGGFGADNPTFSVDAVDFREDDRVAILCGAAPAVGEDQILGIDQDGTFSDSELIETLGDLPATLSSKNGRHKYFRVPAYPSRARLKQWNKIATCEGGALDLRWHGGYLIENGDWDQQFDVSKIATLEEVTVNRIVALGSKSEPKDSKPKPLRSEVVATLAKVWPKESGRYESALALGGILGRSDLPVDDLLDLASDIFSDAGADDRREQVLASVDEVRAGGNAYGWPKLKEHMIGKKTAVTRACNQLSRYLGIDAKRERKADKAPENAIWLADCDVFIDDRMRRDILLDVAAELGTVYQNQGRLVTIGEAVCFGGRDPESGERRNYVLSRALKRLGRVTLQEILLGPGAPEYWKRDAGENGPRESRTNPQLSDCGALLERGEYPVNVIRPLRGVATCPMLRPDGSVLQVDGYDSATGWFLALAPEFASMAPIPEAPTKDDALAALKELIEPFVEFPWSKSVAALLPLSLILSAVARAAIEDVPLHVFDASAPGSGKTLSVEIADLIAYGEPAGKLTFPGAKSEELEKILGSAALAGANRLAWDNVAPGQLFGGEAIEKVLTCGGRTKLRELGKSEAPDCEWHAIQSTTGNQLTLTGDAVRRSFIARLESDLERPEERSGFAISDLKAWTTKNRVRLVRAALVILRAHVVAGRPEPGPAVASFESWGRVVADALRWASDGADLRDLAGRHAEEVDPVRQAQTALLSGVQAFCAGWPHTSGVGRARVETGERRGEGAATARELHGYLTNGCTAPGTPEIADALATLKASVPAGKWTAKHVADALGTCRGKVVAGMRLIVSTSKGVHRFLITG